MVDRQARNKLAEGLRHLTSGQITNYAFEDCVVRTKDKVVNEIEQRLVWPRYDDMHEHRLAGNFAITDGTRRDFARAILFLKTNLDYEWLHQTGLRGFINSWFRLRPLRQTPPIKTGAGDLRYWPFFRRSDYNAARKSPAYLSGGQVQQDAPEQPPPANF